MVAAMPVTLPDSWLLLASGLMLLGVAHRRRALQRGEPTRPTGANAPPSTCRASTPSQSSSSA